MKNLKLNVAGVKMLTKEQMKFIIGGEQQVFTSDCSCADGTPFSISIDVDDCGEDFQYLVPEYVNQIEDACGGGNSTCGNEDCGWEG